MNNEMTTDNMSTEEVIDILKGIVFNGFDRTTPKERQALDLAIKALEERPQGEWIVDEDNGILKYMKCSNCGKVAEWLDDGRQLLSNFCPNCGADLRGEE